MLLLFVAPSALHRANRIADRILCPRSFNGFSKFPPLSLGENAPLRFLPGYRNACTLDVTVRFRFPAAAEQTRKKDRSEAEWTGESRKRMGNPTGNGRAKHQFTTFSLACCLLVAGFVTRQLLELTLESATRSTRLRVERRNSSKRVLLRSSSSHSSSVPFRDSRVLRDFATNLRNTVGRTCRQQCKNLPDRRTEVVSGAVAYRRVLPSIYTYIRDLPGVKKLRHLLYVSNSVKPPSLEHWCDGSSMASSR